MTLDAWRCGLEFSPLRTPKGPTVWSTSRSSLQILAASTGTAWGLQEGSETPDSRTSSDPKYLSEFKLCLLSRCSPPQHYRRKLYSIRRPNHQAGNCPPSAATVPNTSELLPDPETPVNTVKRRFGISTWMSLRLFTRAPCTWMRSWLSATCRSAGREFVLEALLIVSSSVGPGRLRGLRRRGRSLFITSVEPAITR